MVSNKPRNDRNLRPRGAESVVSMRHLSPATGLKQASGQGAGCPQPAERNLRSHRPVGDIRTRSAQPGALPPSERIRTEQQPTDCGPFVARFRAQGEFEG